MSPLPVFTTVPKEECSCAKCIPPDNPAKFRSSKSISRLLTGYATFIKNQEEKADLRDDKDFEFKVEGYKRMGPPRTRLMPVMKMRDMAIEYGEELYNIGLISYKNQNDEPYESNLVKEQTILIVLLQDLKASIKIEEKKLATISPISIGDIQLIDPMAFNMDLRSEHMDSYHPNSKSISDIYFFKDWLNFIFNSNNKYPLWCLRHFMRDIGLLQEFELMAHMRELETDTIICVCGKH